MSRFLQIHPDDNVVVCLETLKEGDKITLSDGREIVAKEDIVQIFNGYKAFLGL